MDQNLNSKKDLKNLLTSILNKNKIKFSLFITFLLVALITYSILNQKNKTKNILLSEKFIKAGILFSNEKKVSTLISHKFHGWFSRHFKKYL